MANRSGQSEAQQRILATIRQIPYGRVTTYGRVAERAGLPRRAAAKEAPQAALMQPHSAGNASRRLRLPRSHRPRVRVPRWRPPPPPTHRGRRQRRGLKKKRRWCVGEMGV